MSRAAGGALVLVLVLVSAVLDSQVQAQQPERFSLALFHFNIQYVAGGLTGYPSGKDTNDNFALDDDQVHDRIIAESIEPLLDLLQRHPAWHLDIEMQAYLIEVMQARHPEVLLKLVQLVSGGQVELVTFHYSDQLFLAYPRLDLERSHDLLDVTLTAAGLQPSPVVFCQEGQFGVGMGPFGQEHGRNILVLPKNLFKYQHSSSFDTAPPLFDLNGVDVILGARGFSTPEVEVEWSFLDDGELMATGGLDPYMGKNFVQDANAVAKYEQQLSDAESQGFRIATIGEFVAFAKANHLQQDPLPPMLDGTWQPKSTDSMKRWLGASGLIDQIYDCERDNAVLTGNTMARHWILAAEILVAEAEKQGKVAAGSYHDKLLGCWKTLTLGEVSDASGINPFLNEVQYGLNHGQAASQCADAIVREVGPKLGGPYLAIDTAAGTVTKRDDQPSTLSQPEDPLFTADQGFAVTAPGRKVDLTWEAVGLDGTVHRLTVVAAVPDNQQRTLEVVFPQILTGFYLMPGLEEEHAVFHPFTDFDLEEGKISLPLASGLLGIDKDLWLIQQTDTVHVAASFVSGEPLVHFVDETLDPTGVAHWVFWIVQGDAQKARTIADQLNLHPTAYVFTDTGSGRGCGCGLTPDNGLGALALLGLILRRAAPGRRRQHRS